MSTPLYVPRINNNDDFVKVVRLAAAVGDQIQPGDVVAEVESEKSVASVEAEQGGYVLKILCAVDDQVAVGGVMMWLGASADEAVSAAGDGAAGAARHASVEPTAKARALLAKYGLNAHEVASSSDRLSAADVEAHVTRRAKATPEPDRGNHQ
jgi:pyruvate/2-oxoglutarate dehydrogenase complex dihydrolipoamide acyltransferase (E2) component